VQGLVVNPGAGGVRVVANEVLYLGHYILRVNASDFGGADLAGKKGVFAKGVVALAVFEIAVDRGCSA
jgi:hypothetical protein